MTPERWVAIKEAFDAAIALQVDGRRQYLDRIGAADLELLREVESLLRSHEAAASAFLTPPVAEPDTPPNTAGAGPGRVGGQIGPYRVTGELGRGGMGEVYRAVRADGNFTKEVALKVVRGGIDAAFIVDRFRNERQILASLDHPNIARLLDGGTTEDGLPYLVMELVDGAPIDVYCDAHRLTIRDRLRLFREVCAAVQYAHQRLVVHRDIKPTNVLVTSAGVPKLLDFGIAKILDASKDGPITLARPMTLEYASPEQILGEPITTATDVYSLGVVLYQLVTGRSPYRTDRGSQPELSRAIVETDPPRPSTIVLQSDANHHREMTSEQLAAARGGSIASLQRSLAGDLDNILLMALKKEPRRRYPSVEPFAEDLRRYLENRPVTARGDSWGYRTEKFVARHRYAVAASAVAVLILVAGVAAIARESRAARREAGIAQAQRALAERRFDDVRELSNSLIFEVHDAIRELPGATPARKLLLDRALKYLDDLARDAGGNTDLRRELAWGYQRLAVVQGSSAESSLGNEAAAESSNRKATALFESVAKANPADTIDQLNVAMGHRLISFGLIPAGGGRDDLDQAMAITERLLKADPANPKVKSERSIEYQNLALMQDAAGDRAAALESFRKDLALKEQLVPVQYRGVRRMMAMVNGQVGDELTRVGLLAQALEKQRESLRWYEEGGSADNLDSRREMAVARMKFGETRLMTGDTAGAAESFRSARDAIELLARNDPANTMAQLDLAGVDYEDGRTLAATGDYRGAIAALTRALRRFEAAGSGARSSGDVPHDLSVVHIWLGDVRTRQKDFAGALESYRHAASLLDQSNRHPLDDDSRCELATSLNRIGEVLMTMGKLDDASAALQRARALLEPPPSAERHDVPALYAAAETVADIGELAQRQARASGSPGDRTRLKEQAEQGYRQGLEIWRGIPSPASITPIGVTASAFGDLSARLAQEERR
jgi:serine/threonine protein kinase/tetratricopeptide (TPR) repeat protein